MNGILLVSSFSEVSQGEMETLMFPKGTLMVQ